MKHIAACPIGKDLIDENVVRLNAFFTIIILVFGWFFPMVWLFLVLDFALRIKATKFSPVARFSRFLMHEGFKAKPKPINAKPKLFAAKIGLIFSLLLTLSYFFKWPVVGMIVLVLFLTAASLEAFFNFCLGCLIYQVLTNLGLIKTHQPSIKEINHRT